MSRLTVCLVLGVALASFAGAAIAQEQPYLPETGTPAPPSAEQQLSMLQARFHQQGQALENHRQLLAQARSEIALKDELLVLGRERNAEIYGIASEILDRYAGVGVSEALSRREPFVQASRVRLENRVQDYEDRLRAARIHENTLPPSVERRMQEDLDRRRSEAGEAEAAATPATAPTPDQ